METAMFRRNLDRCIEFAKRERVVLMCAEAVPWRCHRALIADALVARGIQASEISSRIRGRAVVAVHLTSQHPQHGHLLPTVMRGVRQAAGHHPCSGAFHIEKPRWSLPPAFVLLSEDRKPLSAVFRVASYETRARFFLRKRRSADVDSEHGPEPRVLAHTLVHHLFVDAASTR